MYSERYILITTLNCQKKNKKKQATSGTFELLQERKSALKIQSICKKFPEQSLLVEIFKQ